MKKFEPHYRLVRYGMATKIEKASRQQREYNPGSGMRYCTKDARMVFHEALIALLTCDCRQAEKEQVEGVPRYCQNQGCEQGQEEIEACGGIVERFLYSCMVCVACSCSGQFSCLHDLLREWRQACVCALGVTHSYNLPARHFVHHSLMFSCLFISEPCVLNKVCFSGFESRPLSKENKGMMSYRRPITSTSKPSRCRIDENCKMSFDSLLRILCMIASVIENEPTSESRRALLVS